MKSLILLVLALGGLLAAAVWGAVSGWLGGPEVDIGIHGWIALIGGSVITFAVGGGLMALVFYSARKGFDDAAVRLDRGADQDAG